MPTLIELTSQNNNNLIDNSNDTQNINRPMNTDILADEKIITKLNSESSMETASAQKVLISSGSSINMNPMLSSSTSCGNCINEGSSRSSSSLGAVNNDEVMSGAHNHLAQIDLDGGNNDPLGSDLSSSSRRSSLSASNNDIGLIDVDLEHIIISSIDDESINVKATKVKMNSTIEKMSNEEQDDQSRSSSANSDINHFENKTTYTKAYSATITNTTIVNPKHKTSSYFNRSHRSRRIIKTPPLAHTDSPSIQLNLENSDEDDAENDYENQLHTSTIKSFNYVSKSIDHDDENNVKYEKMQNEIENYSSLDLDLYDYLSRKKLIKSNLNKSKQDNNLIENNDNNSLSNCNIEKNKIICSFVQTDNNSNNNNKSKFLINKKTNRKWSLLTSNEQNTTSDNTNKTNNGFATKKTSDYPPVFKYLNKNIINSMLTRNSEASTQSNNSNQNKFSKLLHKQQSLDSESAKNVNNIIIKTNDDLNNLEYMSFVSSILNDLITNVINLMEDEQTKTSIEHKNLDETLSNDTNTDEYKSYLLPVETRTTTTTNELNTKTLKLNSSSSSSLDLANVNLINIEEKSLIKTLLNDISNLKSDTYCNLISPSENSKVSNVDEQKERDKSEVEINSSNLTKTKEERNMNEEKELVVTNCAERKLTNSDEKQNELADLNSSGLKISLDNNETSDNYERINLSNKNECNINYNKSINTISNYLDKTIATICNQDSDIVNTSSTINNNNANDIELNTCYSKQSNNSDNEINFNGKTHEEALNESELVYNNNNSKTNKIEFENKLNENNCLNLNSCLNTTLKVENQKTHSANKQEIIVDSREIEINGKEQLANEIEKEEKVVLDTNNCLLDNISNRNNDGESQQQSKSNTRVNMSEVENGNTNNDDNLNREIVNNNDLQIETKLIINENNNENTNTNTNNGEEEESEILKLNSTNSNTDLNLNSNLNNNNVELNNQNINLNGNLDKPIEQTLTQTNSIILSKNTNINNNNDLNRTELNKNNHENICNNLIQNLNYINYDNDENKKFVVVVDQEEENGHDKNISCNENKYLGNCIFVEKENNINEIQKEKNETNSNNISSVESKLKYDEKTNIENLGEVVEIKKSEDIFKFKFNSNLCNDQQEVSNNENNKNNNSDENTTLNNENYIEKDLVEIQNNEIEKNKYMKEFEIFDELNNNNNRNNQNKSLDNSCNVEATNCVLSNQEIQISNQIHNTTFVNNLNKVENPIRIESSKFKSFDDEDDEIQLNNNTINIEQNNNTNISNKACNSEKIESIDFNTDSKLENKPIEDFLSSTTSLLLSSTRNNKVNTLETNINLTTKQENKNNENINNTNNKCEPLDYFNNDNKIKIEENKTELDDKENSQTNENNELDINEHEKSLSEKSELNTAELFEMTKQVFKENKSRLNSGDSSTSISTNSSCINEIKEDLSSISNHSQEEATTCSSIKNEMKSANECENNKISNSNDSKKTQNYIIEENEMDENHKNVKKIVFKNNDVVLIEECNDDEEEQLINNKNVDSTDLFQAPATIYKTKSTKPPHSDYNISDYASKASNFKPEKSTSSGDDDPYVKAALERFDAFCKSKSTHSLDQASLNPSVLQRNKSPFLTRKTINQPSDEPNLKENIGSFIKRRQAKIEPSNKLNTSASETDDEQKLPTTPTPINPRSYSETRKTVTSSLASKSSSDITKPENESLFKTHFSRNNDFSRNRPSAPLGSSSLAKKFLGSLTPQLEPFDASESENSIEASIKTEPIIPPAKAKPAQDVRTSPSKTEKPPKEDKEKEKESSPTNSSAKKRPVSLFSNAKFKSNDKSKSSSSVSNSSDNSPNTSPTHTCAKNKSHVNIIKLEVVNSKKQQQKQSEEKSTAKPAPATPTMPNSGPSSWRSKLKSIYSEAPIIDGHTTEKTKLSSSKSTPATATTPSAASSENKTEQSKPVGKPASRIIPIELKNSKTGTTSAAKTNTNKSTPTPPASTAPEKPAPIPSSPTNKLTNQNEPAKPEASTIQSPATPIAERIRSLSSYRVDNSSYNASVNEQSGSFTRNPFYSSSFTNPSTTLDSFANRSDAQSLYEVSRENSFDRPDPIAEKACNNFMYRLMEFQRQHRPTQPLLAASPILPTTVTPLASTTAAYTGPIVSARTANANINLTDSAIEKPLIEKPPIPTSSLYKTPFTSAYSSSTYTPSYSTLSSTRSPSYDSKYATYTSSYLNSSPLIGNTSSTYSIDNDNSSATSNRPYVSAIRKRRTLFSDGFDPSVDDHLADNNQSYYLNSRNEYPSPYTSSIYKTESANDNEDYYANRSSPVENESLVIGRDGKTSVNTANSNSRARPLSIVNEENNSAKIFEQKSKNNSNDTSTLSSTPKASAKPLLKKSNSVNSNKYEPTSSTLPNSTSSSSILAGNIAGSVNNNTAKIRSTVFDRLSVANDATANNISAKNNSCLQLNLSSSEKPPLNAAPKRTSSATPVKQESVPEFAQNSTIKAQNEIAIVTSMTPKSSTTSATNPPSSAALNRMRSLDSKSREKFKTNTSSVSSSTNNASTPISGLRKMSTPSANTTANNNANNLASLPPQHPVSAVPSCYLYSSPATPNLNYKTQQPLTTSNVLKQQSSTSASKSTTSLGCISNDSCDTNYTTSMFTSNNANTSQPAKNENGNSKRKSHTITLTSNVFGNSTNSSSSFKSTNTDTNSITRAEDVFERLSKRTNSMKNLANSNAAAKAYRNAGSSSSDQDMDKKSSLSSTSASSGASSNDEASNNDDTFLNSNSSNTHRNKSRTNLNSSKTSVFERLYKSNIAAHLNQNNSSILSDTNNQNSSQNTGNYLKKNMSVSSASLNQPSSHNTSATTTSNSIIGIRRPSLTKQKVYVSSKPCKNSRTKSYNKLDDMHHHNECSDDSNDNNTNPIENDTSSEHSESSLKIITNKNDVDFIMPDQEQQDNKRINEQVSENVEINKSSTPRSARSVTSSSPPSSSSFLTHKLMDLFKK